MTIDWTALSRDLGTRFALGGAVAETGGSDLAQQALDRIVGEVAWQDAVEHYIAARPGYELVRSVLSLAQPGSAMEYCRVVFESDRPLSDRQGAVELLRAFADRRALDWVPAFLADGDPQIRHFGLRLLDRVLWDDADLKDPAVVAVFEAALIHPDEDLVAAAKALRDEWRARVAEWEVADAAANARLRAQDKQT
ncbi:MAG: hypothetical protein HKO95_07975 [Rhodobacteraceae bacterium]|nr:hypothetical protein [Alphaproteobacteria bacterium]MBT8475175.1 hypothetical protein [Alphaproteobacteria bacterium]NNF71872.1 hypothetical protein [Paracoccaceae bacterium]NNK66659.1 hypothetical protein [Paracoccaceae bacterium]